MRELKEIPLDNIYPPDNPMREDTTEEGLTELCESIAAHGLSQPIGVAPIEDGFYTLIWGCRRYLAHRQLGLPNIPAFICEVGEEEADILMAHENFHRTQLNPIEEGKFYKRHMETHNISYDEMARRARCHPGRVREMINLLDSDADVLVALKSGRLSKAQALEINRIKDDYGRIQALTWATQQG